MQLAGLALVVQGEIASVILITPRSDHCVTLRLCHHLRPLFLCLLQSEYEIIENFQIGDSRFQRPLVGDRRDQIVKGTTN
jgi:hypothetical protein